MSEAGRAARATDSEATTLDFWMLAAAVALAPLTLRATQLEGAGIATGWGDARGLLADLGLAFIVAAGFAGLLSALGRRRGLLVTAPLLLLWLALNNANLEHVRTLGTLVGAAHAGFLFDDTFFKGSALHLSHPMLLGVLAVSSLAALIFATRRRLDGYRVASLGALGLLLLGVRAISPPATEAAAWRQTHFALEAARWLDAPSIQASEERPIPGLFPASLDGQARIGLGHRGENVLLVVLEGVSGAYLDRIAALHGLEGNRPRLPRLDRLSERGLTLVNFVNQQRQTNRGLYALVCGDLPKLTTSSPKMSDLGLLAQDAHCLPRALGRNGYTTAFLQSAPLSFMAKDKFLPLAGYDRFHGDEFFEAHDEKNSWGVNDRTFFRESLRIVNELDAGDQPWFLTLLTSGTHHPFNIPEEFVTEGEVATFDRAIDFLDLAVSEFIESLDARGVLEDTIVLLTSDESFGLEGMGGGLSDSRLMLSQAWGVLIALLPTGEVGDIETAYSQLDVSASILDLLGLQHEVPGFRGRSFFREYPTPRRIPFANTYMRMSAIAEGESGLLLCREDRSDCRRYRLRSPPLLFAGHTEVDATVEQDDEGVARLADLQARSVEHNVLGADIRTNGPIEYPLLETPTTVLLDAETYWRQVEKYEASRLERGVETVTDQIFMPVFGNQYLSLPENHGVTIELDLVVRGEHPVELMHSLRAVPGSAMPSTDEYRKAAIYSAELRGLGSNTLGMRPRFVDRTVDLGFTRRVVRPDEPFHLVYSYSTAENLERLNARLVARNAIEGTAGLIVRQATLRIEPLGPGVEPVGLEIHEYTHRQPVPDPTPAQPQAGTNPSLAARP